MAIYTDCSREKWTQQFAHSDPESVRRPLAKSPPPFFLHHMATVAPDYDWWIHASEGEGAPWQGHWVNCCTVLAPCNSPTTHTFKQVSSDDPHYMVFDKTCHYCLVFWCHPRPQVLPPLIWHKLMNSLQSACTKNVFWEETKAGF